MEPLRVLVVEDSADDASLVELEILRQGIPLGAYTRVDTREAFAAALASSTWDLVLADYHLPAFSGPEALATLLAHPELDIPFILMSGTIGEEAAVDAMKQGAHDFIRKDNLARLGVAIQREIAEAKERQGRREAELNLQRSEEKFRKLFHHASDAILYMDAGGLILDANLAAGRMLEGGRESPAGQSLLRYVPVSYRKAMASRLRRLAASGTDPVLFESVLSDIQGQEFPVEFNMRRLDGDSGPACVAIARDISERKRAEAQIRFMADHDHLTQLPNRRLTEARIELLMDRARRYGSYVAVLFFDLDRFKRVNDSHGHHLGDQLLRGVAERLTACVRGSDLVARWGGDEFLLVLPDIADVKAVAPIVEKILAEFQAPFILGGHELTVNASIGISLYPDDGMDTATLLRNADMAMYTAKIEGRNTFRFFEPGRLSSVSERMVVTSELRSTIERGELSVHYQPQWDLAEQRIVGMEALLRWNHPHRGLIAPAHFIPLAEESGQVHYFGQWVLAEACRQNVEWQALGLPVLPVAVNVSALELLQENFLSSVKETLQVTGLPAHCLELEVTEGQMHEIHAAKGIFDELKALGVSLAIDDFGTGFSNLAYLQQLPVDRLKIDQSFIKDVPDDAGSVAIVRAIIGLAESFQVKVIAEGVETERQARFLLDEDCRFIQGYFFSPPLPPGEMAEMLSKQRHGRQGE